MFEFGSLFIKYIAYEFGSVLSIQVYVYLYPHRMLLCLTAIQSELVRQIIMKLFVGILYSLKFNLDHIRSTILFQNQTVVIQRELSCPTLLLLFAYFKLR